MGAHWSANLRRQMENKGWGVADLARAMGRDGDGALLDRLYKYHRGEVDNPRGDAMDQIAAALGTTAEDLRRKNATRPTQDNSPIEVIGEVAAGRYVEFHDDVRMDFDPFQSPLSASPEFPAGAQFDLRVSGTSINKLAADGDFLRCVSLTRYHDLTGREIDIREDDFVIFERHRGSSREITAKRFRHRGSRIELLPYSTDPRWQTSIELPTGDYESEEGRIVALVLLAYKPARGLR